MIELAPDVIMLLFCVAFMGGFIDSVAGGGGLVVIPSLLAAGLSPVMAITTGKFQAAVGMTGTVWTYWRAGHVDFSHLKWPLIATLIGAGFGGAALMEVDTRWLMIVLPLLLIAMAFYFLFMPRMNDADRKARLTPLTYSAVAAGIGFYDGFFGPGGGSFFMLSLVTLMGMGILKAAGNAKALNWMSITISLAILIAGGNMNWLVGGVMAVGNVIGSQLGSRSAIRWGTKIIRPLVVVVSLAMTTKLLLNPDNPLRQIVLGWF